MYLLFPLFIICTLSLECKLYKERDFFFFFLPVVFISISEAPKTGAGMHWALSKCLLSESIGVRTNFHSSLSPYFPLCESGMMIHLSGVGGVTGQWFHMMTVTSLCKS